MKSIPTPWGPSQTIDPIGDDGIIQVTTASHGGIFVPPAIYQTMPPELRCNVYGGGTWFEEDIEVALVMLAFPRLFSSAHLEAAINTIAAYGEADSTYHSAAVWLAANRGRLAVPEAAPAAAG